MVCVVKRLFTSEFPFFEGNSEIVQLHQCIIVFKSRIDVGMGKKQLIRKMGDLIYIFFIFLVCTSKPKRLECAAGQIYVVKWLLPSITNAGNISLITPDRSHQCNRSDNRLESSAEGIKYSNIKDAPWAQRQIMDWQAYLTIWLKIALQKIMKVRCSVIKRLDSQSSRARDLEKYSDYCTVKKWHSTKRRKGALRVSTKYKPRIALVRCN